MGRKDKLRREKQARQRKIENNAPVATTATTTTIAQTTPAAATTGIWNNDMFPKSEFYVQRKQHNKDTTFDELSKLLFHGATEYGCIHSLAAIGRMLTLPRLNGRKIYVGQPWLLEGSIRGSICCVTNLTSNYCEAKPEPPHALVSYWMKMLKKYQEWSGDTDTIETESTRKLLKDDAGKRCAICSKEDTETLTLRQCIGCSMYCYCSKEHQTKHWAERNHSGECRQLKILNKYHKPYAKEIRKAAIRGETTHPALEKLRNKLGLTRPLEEYQQLRDTNTYEGKQIDPLEYLVARRDGSVWIGSIPTPFGLSSDTDTDADTTATRATTTTTTPTARASSKDDQKLHKIK